MHQQHTEATLMMVDTQVYGYVGDGAVYCPECVTAEAREDFAADNGVPMGRVYSHEDDGRGLYCDTCTDDIFEPDSDYCRDCDSFDGCETCPNCYEHIRPEDILEDEEGEIECRDCRVKRVDGQS